MPSLLVRAPSSAAGRLGGAGAALALGEPSINADGYEPISGGLVALRVDGMTCQACVRAVGGALRAAAGDGADVHVDLGLRVARVEVVSRVSGDDIARRLVEAVEAVGFGASLQTNTVV